MLAVLSLAESRGGGDNIAMGRDGARRPMRVKWQSIPLLGDRRMEESDEAESVSRVRDEWDATCRAAAPLVALWERDRNPRFGISRAARELGMTERALRDWMHREGLPPYSLLHTWYLVVRLLEEAQPSSVSRCSWNQGREPATHFRFLKRETGRTFSELLKEGVDAVRARALEIWHAAS